MDWTMNCKCYFAVFAAVFLFLVTAIPTESVCNVTPRNFVLHQWTHTGGLGHTIDVMLYGLHLASRYRMQIVQDDASFNVSSNHGVNMSDFMHNFMGYARFFSHKKTVGDVIEITLPTEARPFVSQPPNTIDFDNTTKFIRNAQSQHPCRNLLFVLQGFHGYSRELVCSGAYPPALSLLRKIWRAAPGNRKQIGFALNNLALRVVLHVRLGDLSYLSFNMVSTYELLRLVVEHTQHTLRRPCYVYVITDGSKEELGPIYFSPPSFKALEFKVFAKENPLTVHDSFNLMVNAHVLIASRSSFAISASFLSTGVVLYPHQGRVECAPHGIRCPVLLNNLAYTEPQTHLDLSWMTLMLERMAKGGCQRRQNKVPSPH